MGRGCGEKKDKGKERRAQKDKRKKKDECDGPGLWAGDGRCYPMDLEFQFCKMKWFWRSDAQRESP